MAVPRGAGKYVDLNQDPDAMRPKTTQNPGLIKKALSAYTGGVAGKGPEDSSREGTGRDGSGKPTSPASADTSEGPTSPKPATVSAPEATGWDATKKVIQTVFPGTEPFFKAGAAIGDYINQMKSKESQAGREAGVSPALPATVSEEWAQKYFDQTEAP